IAGVFACVAALTGAATFTVLERQSAGQRLFRGRLHSPLRKAGVAATYLASDRPDPGLQRWSKLLPKSPKEMSRLQRRMATAGIHGSTPALVYVFSELAFAAIGFLIPVVALGWAKGLIFGLMGAILG